jgi:hypothetical protein
MARAQSPIKVHESTKEKIRYAALLSGLQQAELVERAVDEYVERHREEFGHRMERAREALLGARLRPSRTRPASQNRMSHVWVE